MNKVKANQVAFVAPVYYSGTSLERILQGIEQTIKENDLSIDIKVFGKEHNTLQPGKLDTYKYTHYQIELLKWLAEEGCKYKKILFIDFFNPGIELVKYHQDLINGKTQFFALFHGASFLESDLMNDWMYESELSWGSVYDYIYVPSAYAQTSLPNFMQKKSKIFPWSLNYLKNININNSEKSIDIVFPHRVDEDKGIDDLIHIASRLTDYKFVITTASPCGIQEDNPYHDTLKKIKNIEVMAGCNDNEYFNILNKSKIVLSCAKQELFGLSVAEAVLCGCVPILPYSQVYPELYPEELLYSTLNQAIDMCVDVLNLDCQQRTDRSKIASQKINNIDYKLMLNHFLNYDTT